MDSDFLVIIPAIIAASVTTILFLYGIWQFLWIERVEKGFRVALEVLRLNRAKGNPILSPTSHEWEAAGVMNPGAVIVNGLTHLFYRAIGKDGVSRIGHATSKDGVVVDDRLPYPVFSLDGQDALRPTDRAYIEKTYPNLVASGGSWGGCEDPRAVQIEDRVYLTFSAFHNWQSLRMAVTSILADELAKKKWNWTKPVFLSAPNQVHKNWMLFPEKIHGKFAILHSIFPKVEIEYVDELDNVGKTKPFISSYEGARSDTADESSGVWHDRVRGAGPPPMRTDRGWLLLYHAMEKGQPHKYKMGAMLLDLDDPTKVLARSPRPILEPVEDYENEGKPGVVYACGATIQNDTLQVYYGGGDSVVCTAGAKLSSFIDSILHNQAPLLTTV
ncbi:MAG: hypothetical protein JWN64_98 [Parcubacteria group bacterium]|nr:hypothetical protein [Parcubacteria group bacterium]